MRIPPLNHAGSEDPPDMNAMDHLVKPLARGLFDALCSPTLVELIHCLILCSLRAANAIIE